MVQASGLVAAQHLCACLSKNCNAMVPVLACDRNGADYGPDGTLVWHVCCSSSNSPDKRQR